MPIKRVQFKLELKVRSSPAILYNFLTTPAGLTQWFAEAVDVNQDDVTFTWHGSDDIAYIVDHEEDVYIRYRWDYQAEDEYFEFRISKAEVSNDTILTITDFCDEGDEEEEQNLWENQIETLRRQIGG